MTVMKAKRRATQRLLVMVLPFVILKRVTAAVHYHHQQQH
jgi:hypothetical protein